MNVSDVNRALLRGGVDERGVLAHVEQLERRPFVFRFEFGLDELPADPGVILVRGPRQYGKSTWLELQLRETVRTFGPGSRPLRQRTNPAAARAPARIRARSAR
jgi:hypothetical protein